ncbi:MAG: M4 family metallopeptidase, partial [Ardenticatenaceae bacterium]
RRWVVGEDLRAALQRTLLRNMWDPTTHPLTGPDPDKVSSPNYSCGTGDNGGVHSNSGVPNHAFAMLTDGKEFNGQTVTALGFVKTTHIYYQAMTAYQVPTTDFPQHADALEASCTDLLGVNLTDFMTGLPSGQQLTAADCQEVADAMAAVEMRDEPLQCNYQPILDPNTPPLCAGATLTFEEDWESGMDGWSLTSDGDHAEWPDYNWVLANTLPDDRPGSAIFAVDEIAGTCTPGGDISGHFTIDSPAIPIAGSQTEVRFEHWVATEIEYDGGNLKISVNGAPFALVPPAAITFNPYNTTLAGDNPNANEPAYSGTDGGTTDGSWGTSIVDLSLLATPVQPGDTIVLRWDFSQDGCNGITGWYVDTISAYTCEG